MLTRRFGAALLLLSLIFSFVGCTTPTKQANKINKDIHDKTAQIVEAASDASQHVEAADQKIAVAATQPGNPAKTTALVNGAHADLGKAKAALAPIIPAAVNIGQKSDQAAQVTADIDEKLQKERDGFFSHKQKLLAAGIATFLVIAAIVVFIVKTAGGGPILDVLGELWASLLKGAIGLARKIGKGLLHVVTLGALAAANKVNAAYDKREAAANPILTNDPSLAGRPGYRYVGTEVSPDRSNEGQPR